MADPTDVQRLANMIREGLMESNPEAFFLEQPTGFTVIDGEFNLEQVAAFILHRMRELSGDSQKETGQGGVEITSGMIEAGLFAVEDYEGPAHGGTVDMLKRVFTAMTLASSARGAHEDAADHNSSSRFPMGV